MNQPRWQIVFEKVDAARRTLELPERASIRQIREKYHELSRVWHPDLNREDPDKAHQVQQRLNEANEVLMEYCSDFVYSFRREDVEAYPTGEDFWWKHFGEM